MFIKIAVQSACTDYIYLQDLLKQRFVFAKHTSILLFSRVKILNFCLKPFLPTTTFFAAHFKRAHCMKAVVPPLW